MEGKFELQFEDNEYYLVDGNSNDTVATTDKVLLTEYDGYMKKLSLKNCEAVVNGYDLHELACDEIGIDISVIKHIDNKVIENDSVSTPIHEAGALGAGLYHRVKGFEIGFQKALEILGDKKFSEDDLVSFGKRCFYKGFEKSENDDANCYTAFREEIGELIHSLQVKEWNVEIVTKPYTEVGEGFELESKREPKLDADGCLILIKK